MKPDARTLSRTALWVGAIILLLCLAALGVGWTQASASTTSAASRIKPNVSAPPEALTAHAGRTTDAYHYVMNSRTRKFHRLDCPWVTKMDPHHIVLYATRDECAADELIPCKTCDP